MDLVPVMFKFERTTLVPILKVTGVVDQMQGIELEKILLYEAVKMIEKLEKFEGKVMELTGNENVDDIPNNKVSVRFFIIFKNEESFQKATSSIKKGMG